MKYKVIEALCLVLAVGFIVFSVTSQRGSRKSAKELYEAICESGSFTDGLEQQDNSAFKSSFGISANDFEGVVYYSSDDIMNVNELLIIKSENRAALENVVKAIEGYASERYEVFSGYAPEQAELLENYVLETKSNAILFYVGGEGEAVQDAFNNALH